VENRRRRILSSPSLFRFSFLVNYFRDKLSKVTRENGCFHFFFYLIRSPKFVRSRNNIKNNAVVGGWVWRVGGINSKLLDGPKWITTTAVRREGNAVIIYTARAWNANKERAAVFTYVSVGRVNTPMYTRVFHIHLYQLPEPNRLRGLVTFSNAARIARCGPRQRGSGRIFRKDYEFPGKSFANYGCRT